MPGALRGSHGIAMPRHGQDTAGPMRQADDAPETPLARLWARLADPHCAVLRESWPKRREWSFLDALTADAPARARDLELAHRFLTGLLSIPVVAVAGLLNAGKSSLVASFLSPEGRERVLRGVSRSAGTHRFTLWCPAAWQADPVFRGTLESLLLGVFGEAAQPLSVKADEAHGQQRERHRLGSPLLAFDAGLDQHRVSLLDCPDIQRHEEGDIAGDRRRIMLQAAARLCSAVFLVLPRSEMEVMQVGEVIEALPKALRVLAVNFCSDESPREISAEARAAWGNIAGVIYIAYDFRHRGYEAFTPAWDPNRRVCPAALATAAMPCFFAVEEDQDTNAPEHVAPGRSLQAISQHVPPERLLQDRQQALLHEFLQRIVREGVQLAGASTQEQDRLQRAAEGMRDELGRLLERDGDTCIKLDPRLLEDFAISIRRSAPWDLKPFLWASQRVASAFRALRSATRGVREGISGRIEAEGRRLASILSDARLDADRLADRLRLWSAAQGAPRDLPFWRPAAERILDRFQRHGDVRLPMAEWEERARDLWKEVPVWRARLAVLTTVLVALAAVAVLSVAGGPVLVALGLKSAALTVTVKELLVVVGLGSVAQGEAARRLDEWLRGRVGRQQQSDLLAIAFDEVGLPRSLLEDLRPPPIVDPRPNPEGFAIVALRGRLREWIPANWEHLQAELENLGLAAPGSG